jgi:drug/metabolite transporter (DMT)-like permease
MSPLAILLILISTFLHAGWNLLLRSRRDDYTILRASIVIAVVGLGPAVVAELLGTRFPPMAWLCLLASGIFEAFYNLGLSRGYQTGNFSYVYPAARALPIILVALADMAQGHWPSVLAWVGMGLVSIGCVIMPLESLSKFNLALYWNRATFWVIVTAVGTVGYTLADKIAVDQIEAGPVTAARYNVYGMTLSAIAYWLMFKLMRQPLSGENGWTAWKWPLLAAGAIFGAYWLVLWSYQLSWNTSYVVAMRQFSIVIGVIIGVFMFHEPAPAWRIAAALTIALGVACVALAK